jgi:hypothetical protein
MSDTMMTKKTYQPPHLLVYGNIRKITKNIDGTSGSDGTFSQS